MPSCNSAELRLLKNDKAHQHRHVDSIDLEPSEKRPKAPEYLSARAKAIFEDFVNRIEYMYAPSDTDMDVFVLYANNKEQLEHYELRLREEGSVYEKSSVMGDISYLPRPEVGMLDKCKSLQLKILSEFGLTPGSRSRIKIKAKVGKKKNSFDDLDKD